MPAEPEQPTVANRRHFLAATAGVLGVAAAPVRKDPVTHVPLDQVYGASDEKGRRFPEKWKVEATKGWWREICKSFQSNGSSNAVLVCGEGMEEAIRSAHWVLCCGARATTAYSQKNIPRPVWLVAFLGNAHIKPVEWTIKSIGVEGRQIRLNYRPRDQTEDALGLMLQWSYSYLAPLPKLTPGDYTVELYDEFERAVTFLRRVEVER